MSITVVSMVLRWLVVIFFAAVGVFHMLGPAPVREQFASWGFPKGFHFVNGLLQFVAAILIVVPASRLWGFGLAAAMMLAAAATVIYRKQYSHAAAPLIIAALVAVVWRLQ